MRGLLPGLKETVLETYCSPRPLPIFKSLFENIFPMTALDTEEEVSLRGKARGRGKQQLGQLLHSGSRTGAEWGVERGSSTGLLLGLVSTVVSHSFTSQTVCPRQWSWRCPDILPLDEESHLELIQSTTNHPEPGKWAWCTVTSGVFRVVPLEKRMREFCLWEDTKPNIWWTERDTVKIIDVVPQISLALSVQDTWQRVTGIQS